MHKAIYFVKQILKDTRKFLTKNKNNQFIFLNLHEDKL